MTNLVDIREEIAGLFDSLREQRDELKVQVHLAGMEMHDEWLELEKQWQHMIAKAKQLKDAAEDSAEDIHDTVGGSLLELGDDIKSGNHKIRTILAQL